MLVFTHPDPGHKITNSVTESFKICVLATGLESVTDQPTKLLAIMDEAPSSRVSKEFELAARLHKNPVADGEELGQAGESDPRILADIETF
jgi:hypothetical protein